MTPHDFQGLLEKSLSVPVRVRFISCVNGAGLVGRVWAEYDGQVRDDGDPSGNGLTDNAGGIAVATDHVRDSWGYDVRGHVVGIASVMQRDDGTHYGSCLWVAPEFRRNGVASAMYNEAERQLGVALTPDTNQSDKAKALWRHRSMNQS